MVKCVAFIVLALCISMVQAQSFDVRVVDPGIGEVSAEPSVVVDEDGGFVLTWQARLEDGVTALRFRRIDANGKSGAIGEIARGERWFVNWADFPSLVVLDNGDWLAHWLQRSGAGYAYDIRVSRSRDNGVRWELPFTLHDHGTRSEHGFVALTPAGAGTARVVWLDGRHTVSADADAGADYQHHHGVGTMTLRSAVVGRDGVTGSTQIDDRVCDCCQTDAVRVGRQTLVVYRDRSDDEIRDLKFIRHDGKRWQDPVPVFNEGWRIAGCPVNGPAIAAQGDRVIVAGYTEATGKPVVHVRTSGDSGRRWHDVVTLVEGGTIGRLDAVAVGQGGFAVSRFDEVGDDVALRVSLHGDQGAVTHTRTLATLSAGRLVGFPRMAASGDAILIAWTQPLDGKPQVRSALLRVERPRRQ